MLSINEALSDFQRSGPDDFQELSSKNASPAGGLIGVFSTTFKISQVGGGRGGNKTKRNLVFDIGKHACEGSGVKTNCHVSFPAYFITVFSGGSREVTRMGCDK